ncbi:esterase family protein [Novosphingobium sp. AP12]|uniref:alpha/beta hydrolase n=1 Tax=Novosphingobium sp. AP12 TaxID=1144305 RepID=UPI0002DEF300|nr:alpha/beta hydrolase-fold protein [Novosphingobium sp. AP12]
MFGALWLMGAAHPETRITVTLPAIVEGNAPGRLLIFAERERAADANVDAVDIGDPDAKVAVAARDVSDFGTDRRAVIDTDDLAFPMGFASLPPGDYRVQAVLDRNGDYNYAGRGPGDLVSNVVTVRLPLASPAEIALDHAIGPGPGQFDTAGYPPAAVAQIAASREHLHDERIVSPSLTRFRGIPQTINAWVLTPPGYDAKARVTYPVVYTAGGFGATHTLDGQQLSRQWHLMETGAIPPMIWVALDFSSPTGTTEFADSLNNGPWGEALIRDVIPTLEARYRMDARPTGRFLTGHSSGGWFALWTIVSHPEMFGGAWPTSPDPSDFHDFIGVDLYAAGANLYHDTSGAARPLERAGGKVRRTIEQQSRLEAVLGRDGGQFRSFEWVFSPRGADGTPVPMFDRITGAVDPAVVAYWRSHYDIAYRIERDWHRLRKDLDGKVHVSVGTADSNYLDGSVRRLEAAYDKVGGHADFTYVPGATHSMNQVYARDGDRNGLWVEMARAMFVIARPSGHK